ncbi:MAG: DUF1425 domain-containing protein [Kiritimatiellae bacterium]|nr:DUF1425 domain-containing protein [Kiritimatiellia bacterium]
MRLTVPVVAATAALAVLLGAGVSCKTKPRVGGLRVESYPKTTITVNAEMFDGWFKVRDVTIGERQEVLAVTITMENMKGDCGLEYRYRWLDGQGIALTYHTPLWVPVSASRRELVLLNGIAPNPEVKDFILEVRMRQASTRW